MSQQGSIKIAHCIHGLGPGGAQKVIAAIARHTTEGVVHHVYSSSGGAFQPEVEAAVSAVHIVPRHLPRFDPLWVGALRHAFERDGIEVVHGHLFGDTLHSALAAGKIGLPRMATLHGEYDYFSGVQKAAYRWLIPRLDAVVACSLAVQNSWQEVMPPGTAMETIANGIAPPTPELAAAQGPPESARQAASRTTLATVGRLEPEKGLDTLLQALALPWQDGAPDLVIIGDGGERKRLEALSDELGLGERVQFAGLRDDVSGLLPDIDCVVFPSISEGLPIALLEAMAAGRCLVITDLPGMTEAARPDQEALVVPRRNPQALHDALERVVADPELRAQTGAAAERRFRECFTADRMAAAYHALYRRLI